MIGSEVGSNKPFAVIDPPRAKIKVPADIARKNGFAVQVAPEAQEVFGYTDEDIVSVLVGLKIREEDKRVAQISISHDGPNAVAVCMALDERGGVEDTTIDDENGDYLHKLGRELEDFEILQFYYNSPAAKGAESKATF
ncbi:hypothetical protein MMC08_004389 [Hypocenomyce scalaris]|nr:hypothetical protein [Hypocenomyce scalaris]